MPQRVVCLIPARNAADDLPACLRSAASICDHVLALDDGSTDSTGQILEQHPLVTRVLTNPVRPDYTAWDDADNRNRLLDAAAELAPDWILSLDADERITPDDAAALRDFLETDALPGCVYGFKHIAMRGDSEHCLPRHQWIYRLFSFSPGQRFPERKLHFVPAPTSIPRALWFRTTIRIQHYGSATAERRLARFEKYAEADPARRFQNDYSHLLHNPVPSELVRWAPRPPGLPVLEGAAPPDPDHGEDRPALSAIVIAQNNAGTIARTVRSIVRQECPERFETIVVVSGSPATAAIVRRDFPDVKLIEFKTPLLPGAARNAGLAEATGEFISFPGSHVELPPGSLAARLAAHRRGYALVTGIAINGNRTRAGWASYFLDHHEGLPGHGASVIEGAPAHCSYARGPLIDAGGFPEDRRTGEDTMVNRLLVERGYVAVRDPGIRFTHRSPCRTAAKLVRHHFTRGRGWGRLQLEKHRRDGHLLTPDLLRDRLFRHLSNRLNRIDETVRSADPALLESYESTKWLIRSGAIAAWAGMWFEILKPAPGKRSILLGTPVRTMAIVTNGPEQSVTIVQIDEVDSLIRRASIPLSMRAGSPDDCRQSLGESLGSGGRPSSTRDMLELLQHTLDLDLDGVVLTSSRTIPFDIDSVEATSLRDGELSNAIDRLRRFRLDDWLETGTGEHEIRAALEAWKTHRTWVSPEPKIWMP